MIDLLVLAQAARPDLGWLAAIASRLLLVLQLGATAIMAVRVGADVVGGVVGGKPARMAAKEAIPEHLGWFVGLWVVGFLVTLALWIAGQPATP